VVVKPLGAVTVSVADFVVLPLYAPPLQASVYVTVPTAVGVSGSEPLAACAPVQPPLAVQLLPEFEDQVSVAVWPSTMLVGATVSVSEGAGVAGVPPPPP
jgi:hypothetical protein